MKYRVTLDGEPHEVELVEHDGRTWVRRDGAEVPVEMAPIRDASAYSMRIGTDSIRVVASGPNDDLLLTLVSETWHATVVDEREALLAAALGVRSGRTGGAVRSVMPGIVREIRVAAGDTVTKGQPLCILEAMKMQNEVRADADGTVSEVHVAVGAAVAKGDLLVTLG